MDNKKLKFESKLIHGAQYNDALLSANVPVYQTSTFAFKNADEGARCFSGESNGFIYTRIGNPTIAALESLVAKLENGAEGIATSSGMAAVNTILMAMVNPSDHIVSTDGVYGPSRLLMEYQYSRFGVQSTFVDTSKIENIRKAIKPNTRMLYIETPANPTLAITDLSACAKIAKEKKLLFVVDNTFCSPYLQNPLDMGADIVLHSMTKFLNGHADIVAGMIIAKDKALCRTLRSMMIITGCNMDPHQAFMVIRGVKTLSIRIEKAQQNATKIATFLEKHPKISWISYPGLKSFPQFALAKKQMRGPGAMISFGVKGGLKAGRTLMDNVQLALLAVSLGGVESLIQHPASMTHSKMPKEARMKAGITDELVRFSVGIEDADDLIDDLNNALKKV